MAIIRKKENLLKEMDRACRRMNKGLKEVALTGWRGLAATTRSGKVITHLILEMREGLHCA